MYLLPVLAFGVAAMGDLISGFCNLFLGVASESRDLIELVSIYIKSLGR